MTDAEWLACTNPQPMIVEVSGHVGEDVLRQFAVACCRRIWHLLPEPRDEFLRVLELSASVPRGVSADPDRAKLYEAAAASCAAFAAAAAENLGVEAEGFAAHALYAASALTGTGYADREVMIWSVAADAAAADDATASGSERAAQADLLRKLLGDPQARQP